MKRAVVVCLLAFGVGGAAAAAPIYRCGPDGRVYSQVPCAGGRLIDAADPRSEAERAEAQRVAARERTVANELERERRAQEAAQSPATATGFNARPAPAVHASTAPKRLHGKAKHHGAKTPKDNEDFVAIEPRNPKKRP